MKIKLAAHGIELDIQKDDNGNPIFGEITSFLHEVVVGTDEPFNAAMDGIESLVLAQAMAGFDVTTPQYAEAIETAVEACANNI